MYMDCENCNCFKQEDGDSQPKCYCTDVVRPCMKSDNEDEHCTTKTLASDYGIRMVDEHGNILSYLEDYGKCYMLLVDDIDKALSIPNEFMTCYCEGFDNGMREMPILDKHDFELIGDDKPIVFVNVWDHTFECLCWRDITFDFTIIKKIFGV